MNKFPGAPSDYPFVEVCVDDELSIEIIKKTVSTDLHRKVRLELCSSLNVGGLTPSAGFLRRSPGFPFRVLIRPRPGDFDYSASDIMRMYEDVRFITAKCKNLSGFDGLVIGATRGGGLDVSLLLGLMDVALQIHPCCHFTISRAIDLTTNSITELASQVSELAEYGCDAILTSGRSLSGPLDNVEFLRAFQKLVPQALIICGRIHEDHFDALKEALPNILCVHASCRAVKTGKGDEDSVSKHFGERMCCDKKKLWALICKTQNRRGFITMKGEFRYDDSGLFDSDD